MAEGFSEIKYLIPSIKFTASLLPQTEQKKINLFKIMHKAINL